MLKTSSSRSSPWQIALAIAAALAAASCARKTTARGSPSLLAEGDDDPSTAAVEVHFGPVLLGVQAERLVLLRPADGRAPLHVARLEKSAGFEPAFAIEAAAADNRGSAIAARVRFLAAAPGPAVASATVEIADDSGAGVPIAIQVTGTAIERCEPAGLSLDFASVQVGEAATRAIDLRNPGSTPWHVRIATPPDEGFSLANGSASVEYTIPGAGDAAKVEIPFEFRPRVHGDAATMLDWPTPEGCPFRTLTLAGFGVSTTLACEPTVIENGRPICRVDFGRVERSSVAHAQVLLRNSGPSEVTILRTVFHQPAEPLAQFSVGVAGMQHRIPAGAGAVRIGLEFWTTAVGPSSGTLEFTTDDPSYPRVLVELRGGGIGPKFQLAPESIDFGAVPITDVAHERIAISNVGLAPEDGGTEANLLLATEQDGAWIEARPELSGSEEFSVLWPPAGYGPAGIAVDASVPLTVLFAPTTFGRFSATLTVHTNDPLRPTAQVQLTAAAGIVGACEKLEVIPPSLVFGTLAPGESVTLPLHLRNASSNTGELCAVSGFELRSPSGDAMPFAIVETPRAILGGEAQAVRVRFAPTSEGSFSGELWFAISDAAQTRKRIPVDGQCGPVPLTVVPRDLELGSDGQSCQAVGQVALVNPGNAPVAIEAVEIDGSTPKLAFAVVEPIPPQVPAAGEAVVKFALRGAVDPGVYAAAATVRLSGGSPPLTIGLHARLSGALLWTDEYHQPPAPQIDLLFVVDDSAAMADKQQMIARNFASAIHSVLQQPLGWHIAVTTTSVGGPNDASGRLLPVSAPAGTVLTRTTPNAEQVFADLVQVGSGGNPSPMLMKPVQLALSEPLLSGHNAGFYRPEAILAVVVISASADADAAPVSDYESFLLNLKGVPRRDAVHYSGIIPTAPLAPEYCAYGTDDAGSSPRAKQLIEGTGGMRDEICNPDWSRGFDSGVSRGYFPASIRLSHVPDLGWIEPFEVTVDGRKLEEYGAKGDRLWWYDSAANSIEIDGYVLPQYDATVRITYHTACGT